MATVTFRNATRRYSPGARPAVDRLNLDIADGEFLVLVGPSGCGKSTTLRMLAGLEPTDQGDIRIDGASVTGIAPADRNVAMVFQNYALYPNMTVKQNMSFALENRKVPHDVIVEQVRKAAEILQIEDLMERKPAQLSGGQRQRVAMGRAIVRRPSVFLMDEPLSNLDAKLRVTTRAQISELQRDLGTTTVYVTHDQTEAMTMGDRVAVLSDGVLQQVASTREIYDNPANVFVAGFIGSPAMNLYELAEPRLGGTTLPNVPTGPCTLGIRPEDWQVCGPDEGAETGISLAVKVNHVEELGHETYVYGSLAPVSDGVPGPALASTTRLGGDTGILVGPRYGVEVGATLTVAPRAGRMHIFDAATGERRGTC